MKNKEKKIELANIINEVRQSFNSPFTIKDLDGRLQGKKMEYRKKTIKTLLEKEALQIVREEGGVSFYTFPNPIHFSFFEDIVERDPRNEQEPGKRFFGLLLDVQFHQRKEATYSLQGLLREYNIYTFPKKNIPDLTEIVITPEVAETMYADLVLKYRAQIDEKKANKPDDNSINDGVMETVNNTRLIVKDMDTLARCFSLLNAKVDAIIRHHRIRID